METQCLFELGRRLSNSRATSARAQPRPALRAIQRGVTLIELLVGIAIGLLVVAVAMGALMVSRGVSGTVSDASSTQQQAAYVMRVVGMQLRQAGSLRLNLNPGTATTEALYMAPVGFETSAPAQGTGNAFTPSSDTISGTASPVTLTVGYRRYTDPVFISAAQQSTARNCVGGPNDASVDQALTSAFQLVGSELRCSGNGAAAQPIAQNVANFWVRYLVQNTTATPGVPTIRQVDAAAVTNWAQVQAVEVCIVLYGTEPLDLPAGSTYTDCDGTLVDMTTLAGQRARRMHLAYRNVFQLRSQGLLGSVL
ncbi:PilW family protein [Paracidovorax sp. MALMAid1276]|uniref:PilW family protein n=1 Tax=Paracidovorax sp. MALMAid1276 TaxID=3411631 RepID=UPI003B99B3E1